MYLLCFILGLIFIGASLMMLSRNNQNARAFKLGILVLIGLGGMALETMVIGQYARINLMNVQVQFVGAEIVKSFILLAFGKQIKNLV